MNILNSASKIVFIMMAIAVCALTFMKIMDAKDFMVLSSMAFAFYFSKPPTPNTSVTTSTTVSPPEEK